MSIDKSNPQAIIDAINNARCVTIGQVRASLHALLPELELLENAPKGDTSPLFKPVRAIAKSIVQASLPFDSQPKSKPLLTNRLQYPTLLEAANNTRLDLTMCLLMAIDESSEHAVITPEGAKLIRALIEQRQDYAGGMSPSEAKYVSTLTLRNHLSAQAKEMRSYEVFSTFSHWSEVEVYLRKHCGYLYCLGNIFSMSYRLMGQQPEHVLCFGDAHKREKGMIIARRDFATGQIVFTPAGEACIRYSQSHLITGVPAHDYVIGTTMRRAITNCENRGKGLKGKVEAADAKQESFHFTSLDEAEERLRTLPPLQHIPLHRGNNFIGIRRKGRKIFRLVSLFQGRLVERVELSALLDDTLQVKMYLDELAFLARLESQIHCDGKRQNIIARGRIEKQRASIIESMLSQIENPEVSPALPQQGVLAFVKSSA